MSLILVTTLICAAAILVAIEFIKFLMADLPADSDYAPGRLAIFCLRHRRIIMLVTMIWLVCWILISGFIVFEFLSNSKAYF